MKIMAELSIIKNINEFKDKSLLIVDDEIRQLILTKATAQKIRDTAREKGMTTLREDGWNKIVAGVTTVEEVLRVTLSDQT